MALEATAPVRVPEGSGCGEASPLGLQRARSCCVLPHLVERRGPWCLSYKGIDPIWGPHPHDLIEP